MKSEAKSGRQLNKRQNRIAADLNATGYATLRRLLSASSAKSLIEMYENANAFRSRVVMQRHAFGMGEYQYFAYPLP